MSEETYSHHKKEDQSAIIASVTRRSFGESDEIGTTRAGARLRSSQLGVDYSTFKAVLSSAVDEIKLEIQDQHQLTRGEIRTVRSDVLEAVKACPAEYLKLGSEFAALFLVFALIVRFTLKLELVNTAFAVFMLFACILYWCMASLKQRSDKKAKHPQA
jgi:hypothetical protein